jgi:hypothetical protein
MIFWDKWVCNLLAKKSSTPKVCKWNYAGALQYVCASDPLGQVPVFVISLKYFSSTPKVCKRKYARTEQYEFLSDLLGEVCL